MKKLLAVVGMMLAANLAAQACDCVSPPVDKAFEKAAAVFVGTVQQVQHEEQSAVKIVTLTVEQAWKGIAADQKTVTVQTASSGKACGYEFQEKVSYLVYAYGEGKSLRTGECSRTKPLANAEEDLVFLTGDGATAKKVTANALSPAPETGKIAREETEQRTRAVPERERQKLQTAIDSMRVSGESSTNSTLVMGAKPNKPEFATAQDCWKALVAAVRAQNLKAVQACCTPEESARFGDMSPEQWKKEVERFEYYQKSIIWPEDASTKTVSAIVINKAPATYMDFIESGGRWLCAGTSNHGANE